jgi:hypothetical protein
MQASTRPQVRSYRLLIGALCRHHKDKFRSTLSDLLLTPALYLVHAISPITGCGLERNQQR